MVLGTAHGERVCPQNTKVSDEKRGNLIGKRLQEKQHQKMTWGL